jgi:HAD superfamily hydrolase (TIGR01509 family)
MPTLKPAGLLFDLDGVLVNSFESWYLLLADLVRNHFSRELTRQEFLDCYWARDLRDIFADLGLEIALDSFCRETHRSYLNRVVPASGAAETLARLGHYPKAIITNTPAVCAWQILAEFSFQRYFAAVITGGEVTRGKPDPEIVYKACRSLSIRPEEAILIGDSTLDVQAGHAAGCRVIGVGIEADFTIHGLPELLALLES